MARDIVDQIYDICRPDGKSGALALLLGTIDAAADTLRSAANLTGFDYARIAIGEMAKIVKAKQAYDEALDSSDLPQQEPRAGLGESLP